MKSGTAEGATTRNRSGAGCAVLKYRCVRGNSGERGAGMPALPPKGHAGRKPRFAISQVTGQRGEAEWSAAPFFYLEPCP